MWSGPRKLLQHHLAIPAVRPLPSESKVALMFLEEKNDGGEGVKGAHQVPSRKAPEVFQVRHFHPHPIGQD